MLIAMVAIAAVVAACVGGDASGEPSGSSGSPSASTGAPSGSADPTATGGPTDLPSNGPDPSETAGETPSLEPSGPAASPASGCSGSDDNRTFFHQAALSMGWPVYCAVLPDGWFLETGSFRLAKGGYLEVTYRGPADAHLALAEGNICDGADVETCAPRDAVIGPAPFGDREGELGRLATSLVLDLDRGATPSWRATGLGLTEEAFRGLAEALIEVED
ncbi:MAG: hypothetical protein EPO36_02570 [Chloroflexota bacterium]|nr:MAG: hypothetical protein EPO36_02570 [Chloroflexota bacterium]